MGKKGAVTTDFIFAMVMVAGVSFVLMALTFSLAAVEVAQYVTFATSRVYFGAHKDKATQQALAQTKFNNIVKKGGIGRVLKNQGQWFELKFVGADDFSQQYGSTIDSDIFEGAQTDFNAKVLNIRIPFFGSTNDAGIDSGGFTARLNSYIGREPTQEECSQFNSQRLQGLSSLGYSPSLTNAYVEISDNGC